jgi:hypothetical protein
MKTYGAGIFCFACHAEPWPTDPAIRQTFSLVRLGPDGRPADSPAEGQWCCEQHLIPRLGAPAKRAPKATPTGALTDFEVLLGAELANLGEEIADGDYHEAKEALVIFQREIERGFAALQKAVRS